MSNEIVLKIAVCLSFLILVLPTIYRVNSAGPLTITITTDQPSYELGEEVLINGTLTLDGSPVSDGLVAVQVVDPWNDLFVMRTRPTGTNVTKRWSMEILEITPCDQNGDPKYSFSRGENAGFKATIKNNDNTEHDGMVILNLYYENGIPFDTVTLWNHSLGADKNITISKWPVTIPEVAPLGEAIAYASILSDLPDKDGYAYSPEKSVTFTITSGSTTATISETPASSSPDTPGTFDAIFRTSDHGGIIGNYSICASCFYVADMAHFTTDRTQFEVLLLGDLNDDLWVDISDVAIVARAFGSTPTHPNWNPVADVDEPWGLIDISDITYVARRYGNYGYE